MSLSRFGVWVERQVGWVEAPSRWRAFPKAVRQFGHLGEVTRVQPVGSSQDDARVDREHHLFREWCGGDAQADGFKG